MSVKGLGTRQRGIRLPIFELVCGGMVLAAIGLFAYHLARYAQNRDLLQTDISIAGIPVTGLTLQEAIANVETIYTQPVELEYRGSVIQLDPAAVGFRVNTDQLRSEVQSKLTSTNNYWGDFFNYLMRRSSDPVTIELNASLSEADLRNYLLDVAARYDQVQSTANYDLVTMSFGAGASGAKLDVEKSIDLIREALYKPEGRRVTLASKNELAANASMDTLKQAINAYMIGRGIKNDGINMAASIMVIDLETGEEMSINPDVAYSAMSTVKIPILINVMSYFDFAIDVDTKWLMAASILCSSNSASNYLMQIVGNNNMAAGLRRVTNTIETLGAKNSFINANIFVDPNAKPVVVERPPTTPNPLFNTRPDPNSQTTAEDMATLLQEIYDCAEYGSGLRAAFPDRFTQTECKQMIELMSGDIIGRLIELGVPEGTRVAHKNGWGGNVSLGANASDAAIVYSPRKTYILVTYFWNSQATEGGTIVGDNVMLHWETIEGISRLVYNYFNPDKPLAVARVPENQFTAVDCVMPNPEFKERIDLNNINNGRFNPDGSLVADACYNYPSCKP
ncbi:MAG: serine hydrolase [Anaerolineae bacterium]|nr:serine hydrolase [Anaerolineae bacterium]